MLRFSLYFNYQLSGRRPTVEHTAESWIRSAASISNHRFRKSVGQPAINSRYSRINRFRAVGRARILLQSRSIGRAPPPFHSNFFLFHPPLVWGTANEGEKEHAATGPGGNRWNPITFKIHERLTTPAARNLHICLNGHLSVPRNCNKCTIVAPQWPPVKLLRWPKNNGLHGRVSLFRLFVFFFSFFLSFFRVSEFLRSTFKVDFASVRVLISLGSRGCFNLSLLRNEIPFHFARHKREKSWSVWFWIKCLWTTRSCVRVYLVDCCWRVSN